MKCFFSFAFTDSKKRSRNQIIFLFFFENFFPLSDSGVFFTFIIMIMRWDDGKYFSNIQFSEQQSYYVLYNIQNHTFLCCRLYVDKPAPPTKYHVRAFLFFHIYNCRSRRIGIVSLMYVFYAVRMEFVAGSR